MRMKSSCGMSYQVCWKTSLMLRSQMYFQHDGAPPHYTLHVRDYLIESFPNHWLGRGGPIQWPPRSPDLTPLDYYFWAHMKTFVYETKVDSRAALRDRIFAAAEHTHPSKQHRFRYSIPLDACRKLHCSWWRTLWTITVKQVLIINDIGSKSFIKN